MSSRAIQVLARPILRSCTCKTTALPAHWNAPSSSLIARSEWSNGAARFYAKKAKGGGAGGGEKGASKSVAAEIDQDEPSPVMKGGKKGKGKGGFVQDMVEPTAADSEGAYDLTALEKSMDDAVEKLRVGLKTVVGRVGRVTPALLDGIRVEMDGQKRPLNEFATVTVKDGKDLLVTCYEESFVKQVSAALYASSLNLTPQATSATALRVPIPKADWEKRQQFVRQASDLCETARVHVRNARTKGTKDIKSDVDGKVVSKDEGRNDTKKLDTATKKRTDEIDGIFEKAKKVLMDE